MATSDNISNPAKPLIFCVVVVGLSALISVWVGLGIWRGYLIGMTVVTFIAYGYDKRQATAAGRRVPETSLHLLALAGGSLGALAGQYVFSHKTSKQNFRSVFIGIVLLQIVLSLVYFWIMG